MSTYTRSDTPLTATRGHPQTWPMFWLAPDETPIDITGMTIAAKLTWRGAEPVFLTLEAGIVVTDAAAGSFKVSVSREQTAALPLGRVAELSLEIVDSAGEAHDFDFPIIGHDA